PMQEVAPDDEEAYLQGRTRRASSRGSAAGSADGGMHRCVGRGQAEVRGGTRNARGRCGEVVPIRAPNGDAQILGDRDAAACGSRARKAKGADGADGHVRRCDSVWMVSPKRTHDSQELFDGVRSLHDPKSAMLVAKLCAMNLASLWQPPEPTRR